MPFHRETLATPVRVRRTKEKEKESRGSASSGGSRKQKESGSSNRSPPQADRSSQLSLYSQQNLTLDQLPALPASGTASPGSAASPVLRGSTCATTQASDLASVTYHHTPAALQQYLQTDDEQPIFKATSTPANDQGHTTRPHLAAKRQQIYSQPLDSNTTTPLATSVREYPGIPHGRSASPSFFNQPLELHTSYSSITSSSRSSSRTEDNRSHTISSPPLPSSSPSVSHPVSLQGFPDLEQPQPRYHQAYLASPPAFAPAVPFNSAPADEPHFVPAYPGLHYYPMNHPAGHPMDLHSLPSHAIPPYANYSIPPHNPGFSNPSYQIPNRGHSSTSSRMSMPTEPLPMGQPLSGNMERTNSLDSPGLPKQGGEDDPLDLLQRIQSAIPDLHLLVNRYRETSGQLGMSAHLIKETEAQKSVALKQKESDIEKLAKELDDVKSKYSAESSKLRFEISNMEEKQKELRDNIVAEQRSKEELQAKNKTLSTELERMQNNFDKEKSRILGESEDWKRRALQDKHALEEDMQRQKQLAETTLQGRLADLGRVHAQEKESLKASLARQKKDLEADHFNTQQELEKARDARRKAVEESRNKHAEDRESWEKERAVLGKGSEEQRSLLTSQHNKEVEAMRRTQEASEERIHQQVQDDMAKLHDQVERLQAGWDAEKGKFARSMADLRAQAVRMDDENKKLQRMADAFGEVTDLRSRGDPFYQDAFKHLERQITDLATEYFKDDPRALPEKTKRSMLAGLPSFLSEVESSSHLRMAFVEHTISRIVTQRIFEPFLFVLSGRLRPADALFVEMSQDLKRNSTRREALWRQRTLHAAYTASSAKQSINNIARYIIDDIVDAIKDLVDRTKWEHVSAAVRRIVKTAAETWRYARLESPLIIASMNSNQIAQAWAGEGVEPLKSGKEVLLSLFPLIKREAAYGIHEDEFKPLDEGYVYSRGRVLCADDTVPRTYQASTQPGHTISHATSPRTETFTSKEPDPRKASRPQSPLVPVPLPAVNFPQDHQWSYSPPAEGPEREDTRLVNEASRVIGQDHEPIMHPVEQEGASRSSAMSSRHSSMTTTASDESAHSASKTASIQDLGSSERLNSTTKTQ